MFPTNSHFNIFELLAIYICYINDTHNNLSDEQLVWGKSAMNAT